MSNKIKRIGFGLDPAIENLKPVVSDAEPLLDYPISPCQHVRRNRQTDLLRRFEIDGQIDLIDPLHRQILGFNTSKNPLDVLR